MPNQPKLLQNRALELSASKASLPYFFFWSQHILVCFTHARLTRVQENLEGNFENRNAFEIALVSLTLVRPTRVQENRGGGPDAARPTADAFGIHFCKERLTNPLKMHPKNH